jgi:hypothetical protein
MDSQVNHFFEGHLIRPEIGDYGIYCIVCVRTYIEGAGLNQLDWPYIVARCDGCLGMNREPIPWAEVMNIRDPKIGNNQ